MTDRIQETWRTLRVCLLLAAATLAVFWPVVHHAFINYDDPVYVYLNPSVSAGLTWPNVSWAFTGYRTGNWHPFTWLSHMLDVQLFGLKPGGHHFVNLLFHTANSLLLFFVLKRLTGAFWRSAFVAALFALHPLHVESVAWVAERKDVLSAFFFMLTLWAYAQYAEARRPRCEVQSPKFEARPNSEDRTARRKVQRAKAESGRVSVVRPLHSAFPIPSVHYPAFWYCLTLALFALGLMSKPMLVTLPCILLLLDYWPLERLQSSGSDPGLLTPSFPRLLRPSSIPALRLVFEKIPFFMLSAVSCIITVVVQGKGHAVASLEKLPLDIRFSNAVVTCVAYLKQACWPANLSIFYPLPRHLALSTVLFSAAVLLLITVAVTLLARRHAYALVGWLWYLGMLVPVIGLVQVGMQARADRYTYLPLIGIFILVTWGFDALSQHPGLRVLEPVSSIQHSAPGIRSGLLACAGCVLLAILGLSTHRQLKYWQDSRSLFKHALRVSPDNYTAWQGLGIADLEGNDSAAAITNFTHALECARSYGVENGYKYFIGATLQLQGKGLEALPYLEESRVAPEQEPERHYRLALSLIAAGRLREAETNLDEALKAKPDAAEFQLGVAALLQAQGQPGKEEQVLRNAVARHPEHAETRRVLGEFLAATNRLSEAEAQFAAALELKPDDNREEAKLHGSYASTLTKSGKIHAAIEQYEALLRLQPSNAHANFDLAGLLSELGNNREAVARYEAALAAEPKYAGALNNLAWLLATSKDDRIRNGSRAVELAERACQVTEWKQPYLIGTLAAAYAEAGHYADAVVTAEKARDKAREAKLDEVAKRNAELLELYRAGKPYHEGG